MLAPSWRGAEVAWSWTPPGGGAPSTSKRWGDYVTRLAWESLGILPEEPEEVSRKREVWAFLLRLLPQLQISRRRWMDGYWRLALRAAIGSVLGRRGAGTGLIPASAWLREKNGYRSHSIVSGRFDPGSLCPLKPPSQFASRHASICNEAKAC